MTNTLHSDIREYMFSIAPGTFRKTEHILHNEKTHNKFHRAEIIQIPEYNIRILEINNKT